jgi:hypothetical protein
LNFFHNINYTMNGKMLILFVILLLGLILCSFLGGKGCKEGFETEEFVGNNVSAKQNSDGSITFIGPNGQSVILTQNSDGSYSGPNDYNATMDNGQLVVTAPDSTTTTTIDTTDYDNGTTTDTTTTDYDTSVETDATTNSTNNYDDYDHFSGASSTTYYGPNGGTAKVSDIGDKGKLVVVNAGGYTRMYFIKGQNSNAKGTTMEGKNDGTATIISNNGQAAVKITMPDGTSTLYTITYNNNQSIDDTINQADTNSMSSSGSDVNNAYVYTGPGGNSAGAVTGPAGNTYVGTNYDSSAYYNSLPPGISANQIPPGQEDLYILKSQVVPPVCPACPPQIAAHRQDNTKCPPCPPCARCPEPAFDCKKVPNYNSFNSNYMPVPVISDFSGFGM